MSILDTTFREYIKTHMEELDESFYGDIQIFFYKGKNRMAITGTDIPKYLTDDGQDAWKHPDDFFKTLKKYSKNRNQMVDLVDNYFVLDDVSEGADLETMRGKWLGFEEVPEYEPLYCVQIDSKKKISVIFAMYTPE